MGCLDKQNGSVSLGNNMSPDDKKYDWFLGEDGRKVYEQTMTPKNYIADDEYYSDFEDQDEYKYYSNYILFKHKGFQSPRIYFDQLVSSMGDLEGASDALNYVGPIEWISSMIRINSENYYLDDDGKVVVLDNSYGYDDIVDKDVNPILKFAFEFNMISFKDQSIPFEKKYDLFKAATIFIAIEYNNRKANILESNPWLYDRSSYVDNYGVPLTEKAFWKIGIQKSTNSEYCQEQYDKQD